MSRAEDRRALRAVGYRGAKSKRNRFTKQEATQVVNQMRALMAARLSEIEDTGGD